MEMVYLTDGVKGAIEAFDSMARGFHQVHVGQAVGFQQPVARSNTMPNPRSNSLPTNFLTLPQTHFQQQLSLPQTEEKDASLHTPTPSSAEGHRDASEFAIFGASFRR